MRALCNWRKLYFYVRWNIPAYICMNYINQCGITTEFTTRSWKIAIFITKHMPKRNACRNISNLLKLALTWIIGKKYVKKRYVKFSGREADARALRAAGREGSVRCGHKRGVRRWQWMAKHRCTWPSIPAVTPAGAALTFDWWHAWDRHDHTH